MDGQIPPKSNITLNKKLIFGILAVGCIAAASYLAYNLYHVITSRSPTVKERYYGMVATDFGVSDYCSQISSSAVNGAAFNPKGYQISLVRSECFHSVAVSLKNPGLCKQVKPISTFSLDGSKMSEDDCLNDINTKQGSDGLNDFDISSQELSTLLNQMGYTEKAMDESEYYKNPRSTSIYDFYQKIKSDPDFLGKINALPSYAEAFDNNKVRSANADEVIIEMAAVDNSQPELCEKISPNAIYTAESLHQTQAYPVRDDCLVSIAFNARNSALCSKLSKDPTNNQYQYYDSRKNCEDNIRVLAKHASQGLDYGSIMPNFEDLETALNKLGYSSSDIGTSEANSPADPYGFYSDIKSSTDPAVKQEFLQKFNQFISSYTNA